MKPPAYIDGAKVIKWAWSGTNPFGYVPVTDSPERLEVYGFAICQYDNSDTFYRFTCDKNWETINDGPYASVEDAIRYLSLSPQYKDVEVDWQSL